MRIKIEFEIELPDIDHTDEDLDEYLDFEFGGNGIMEPNAFSNIVKPDPIWHSFIWEKV